MKGIGPWRYLTWQFGVILYYLRLIVVPNRLCFDCGYLGPWPVKTSWLGDMVWLPAAVLGAAGLGAWLVRGRYPLATFCLLGAALVLVPTSTVMPLADIYVEHRLYLSIALLALLAVAALYDASEWAGARLHLSAGVLRAAQLGVAVAVSGALLGLTVARNSDYADIIRLLEDSAAKAPMSRRTHYNLGNEYGRADQPEKAIAAYRTAIAIDDSAARNFVNLGVQLLKLDRNAEAAEAFEAAVVREPGLGLAYSNLSTAYERLGNLPAATAALERAVRARPNIAGYHKRLGTLYVAQGRSADALARYEASRRLNPGDQDLQRRIAALQGRGG